MNDSSSMSSNSPTRQSSQDQANLAAIQLFTGSDGQMLNPETLAFLKTLQQSFVQQQVDAITAGNPSLSNHSGTVRQLLQQAEAGQQMFQQIIQPSPVATLKIEPDTHRIANHPPPPKKPLTPYMTFSKMIWPSVKGQNSNATVCQVGAIIGDLWRNFTEEQKQPYNELFNKDKLRYEIEMQAYTKATGLRASDIMKQRAEKRAAGINTRTPARSRDSSSQPQSIASVLQQQQEQNERLMPDVNQCFSAGNSNNQQQQQQTALQQYILNEQGNMVQINNQQQALQQILPFYNIEQVQQQNLQQQNQQQQQQQQYLVYHLKADGTTEFLLQPQQTDTQQQQQQQQVAIIKQEQQQQQQQSNNLNLLLGNPDLLSLFNQLRNNLNEKTKEAEVLSYQLAQAYELIHHLRQQNDLLILQQQQQQQQSIKAETMETPASQNNSRPPSSDGGPGVATGDRPEDSKK